jgi:hypothetical protein
MMRFIGAQNNAFPYNNFALERFIGMSHFLIFNVIMKSGRFFLSLLAILGVSPVFAQAPKYSNEFLSIGIGARALGMSNSVVASVDDATASYWNPAGMLGIRTDAQIGLMHAEYFAGIAKFDYGGFAKRIDSNAVFGVSIIRFGVDDIPNTIDLIDPSGNIDYDRISTFSSADYAFIFSYARRTKIPGLDIGANFKIIHRKVGDFGRSWGFGLDASAMYKSKGWLLGANFRDVTTTFNAWSYSLTDQMIDVFTQTGNEIPDNTLEITMPRLLLGGARKFIIGQKKKFSVMPELDVDITFDGKRNTLIKSDFASIDPHLGIEAGYRDLVFLRAGLGNFQKSQKIDGSGEEMTFQPNIGLGVRLKNFTLDYALTDIGDQSVALFSHVFSLKFDIIKPTLK